MVTNVIGGGRSAANGKTRIYIGRGTYWGNPYHLHTHGTRTEVIAKFKALFYASPAMQQRARTELLGKTLVCHCYPKSCHGDVIAEYLKRFDEPTLFG